LIRASFHLKKEEKEMKKIRGVLGALSVLLLAFGLHSVTHAKSMARPERSATSTQDDAKGKYAVTIDNFSFMPEGLTIPAGTTVTWVNKDDVPHTVVSTDGKFKSQALDTNEQFSFTFKDAGTYEYYCSVHPKMTAKVVVQ
jgi:plastocyanin